MQLLLQQLINGLSTGAIYALIAVGYTMVYGVLRLINFAHGDVYMIGAMTGFYAATRWFHFQEPSYHAFALVLLSAVVVCALLGYLIELCAYRPLRNQPRITALITAIGVSMFLEYGGQAVFGVTGKTPPSLLLPCLYDRGPAGNLVEHPNLFQFGQVSMTRIDAIILVVTFLLMLALRFFVMKTRSGMALRAVSERLDTSALMGININRVISLTFVLGSVLAAVAGVLISIRTPKIDPLMGFMPGLKAFIAAVLGGIGNIPGAVAGGLLLGLVEMLVAGYLSSQYQDAVAFVILIAVLLFKPTGLLGSHAIEKV